MQTYTFTDKQLNQLLFATIGMFLEYRDVHGRTEDAAQFAAVNEMFEGLDADRELVEHGEYPKSSLQTGIKPGTLPPLGPSG